MALTAASVIKVADIDEMGSPEVVVVMTEGVEEDDAKE